MCGNTRALLAELDSVLRDAVTTLDHELGVVALHLIGRGGKRLRPALVLLLSGLGRDRDGAVLRAAAAVELLHVASLYHDDVMDRAPSRRGAPSANARWGNAVAAIAGSYLFACAMRLLAATGEEANRLGSAAVAEICTGQLQELESSYDLDLPVDHHLAVLERKTASLFVLPCVLGATLGLATPAQRGALDRFGRRLGLAFQLADDALDLAGDAAQLGKATGTDVGEGVYSLPVLATLRDGGERAARLRALLRLDGLTRVEVAEVIEIVRSGPGIGEALALARNLAGEAYEAAGELPDGPIRTSLRSLTEHAVARTW